MSLETRAHFKERRKLIRKPHIMVIVRKSKTSDTLVSNEAGGKLKILGE